MKGRTRPAGFTIIEVLIVLGISGLLFLVAAQMIAGRQNRTGFTTSIQDFKTEMQQIANDVANGYYPKFSNFSCKQGGTPPSGQPVLKFPDTGSQGSNGSLSTASDTLQGCSFLGKAVAFEVNPPSPPLIKIYPVVGNLVAEDGLPTQGLTGSFPVLLAQSGYGTPDSNFTTEFTQQYNFQYGLTPVWMCYSMVSNSPCNSSSNFQTSVVVFATNQSNSGSGANQSFGTQRVAFAPIPGTNFNQNSTTLVDVVNKYLNYPAHNDPPGYSGIFNNPPGGLAICVADATTNESGLLTIGGNSRAAQINMKIHDGSTNCL